MEVVTSFQHLMKLASDVGKARKNGSGEELEIAIAEHESYLQICLESDRMITGLTVSELSGE